MNLETTFTYNGATVTVRRETIRSRLYRTIVYGKIPHLADISSDEFLLIQTFTRVITQATVDGDLGFVLAKPTDGSDVIMASYEAFMDADPALYDKLETAFGEVNAPPADADLLPVEELPEKKESSTP